VLIVSRSDFTMQEHREIIAQLSARDGAPLVYAMPNDPALGKPTMDDIRKILGAEVLYGRNRLDNIVHDYLIAAMHIDNFLSYIEPGQLIVTPGDRSDLLLTTLTSHMSSAYPDIAGLLLTGGLKPSPNVERLLNGLVDGVSVPVLSVENNTFEAVSPLSDISPRISPDDFRKINTAIGLFESSTDAAAIASRIVNRKSGKMTPKMFEYMLIERARRHRMRIVLPEGEEERILRASEALCNREVAQIILLGDETRIQARIRDLGLCLDKVAIVQPGRSPDFDRYVQTYFELRKAKGINIDEAHDKMLDPTYFGTMMVHLDDADGMVSGSINTTAHTIRPAFEFIKTKPGVSIVSSVFFMCMKDHVLVFGDCAVNPAPSAQELAIIAAGAARTASIFDIEPRVAMLSYSTGTSGKGAAVDVVAEATRIAREMAPDLALDGPIQYDAAIDPDVARTKLPDSPVAGRATVFIFPDLNTGNNTYKAVQRAAGAVAIGPVLQGLNKPVNDLSRGCTVPDILNTVAITAIQAQAEKGLA
jgi:phosphate acetyltransferase